MIACASALAILSSVPWRMVIVAAVVGIVVVGWAVMLWRDPSPAQRHQSQMQADAKSPLKAWTQSAFLVVTGEIDYGYLAPAEARKMLIHWWEIHGPYELRCGLADLEDAGRPDNAWDLLRFIVVARLGAAAQYHSDRDSWHRIFAIAQRLQATYRDWPEMAHAYVVARRQWKGIAIDGSEDDDGMRRLLDHIANLRDTAWKRTAWTTPLHTPEDGDDHD